MLVELPRILTKMLLAKTSVAKTSPVALALLAHLFCSNGYATEVRQIEELVVAASALPTDLAKLSSSVTLLTQDEILRRNSANVVDLLRGIEGVQITQPGGRGGVASLYLRGGEANFTSVFIDGVKVNNPNNTRGGSFDFSTLELVNIERVEIVRGPQSAIYGSDALSGVVNFISKRAIENEVNVRAEAGEQDFLRTLVRGTANLSANQQLTAGAAQTEDSNSNSGGDFELTSLWASLHGQSSDEATNYQLRISTAESERSSFPEDSGGGQLAQIRTLDQGTANDLQANLRIQHSWSSIWESQLQISHYERDEFADSPGVASGARDPVPPNRSDSSLTRRYLQFSNRYSQDNYTISFGADLQNEEGSAEGEVEFAPGFSFPSQYSIDRDIAGVFTDGNIAVNDSLNLLLSLRYDKPDSADSRFSPSVGVVSRLPNGKSVIKANWSKGFKLPSFFALASPLVGNPALRKEEVTSLDVEFSHRFSTRLQMRIALFDSHYKDLIDFDSEAFTNVNRSAVDIRGAEWAIEAILSAQLSLSAFVTYNDIDVKPGGKLRQRPDWQGGVELAYEPMDSVQVYGRLTTLSQSFDSSIPTGDRYLGGYSRADIAASWQLSEQLRLDAAIDNLLDKQYFEAIGFPAVGRRARLALDWRF